MFKIDMILEYDKNIFDFLLKRCLLNQYKKAKQKILS